MKCLYFTNFQDSNTADIPLSCPKVLYVSNMFPVKVRLSKGCSNQDALLEGCLMNMVQVCRCCLVYKEGTHPQSASDLLDTSIFGSLIWRITRMSLPHSDSLTRHLSTFHCM